MSACLLLRELNTTRSLTRVTLGIFSAHDIKRIYKGGGRKEIVVGVGGRQTFLKGLDSVSEHLTKQSKILNPTQV